MDDIPVLAIAGFGGWSGIFPFVGPSPLTRALEQFGGRRIIRIDAQGFLPDGATGDPFDFSQLGGSAGMPTKVDVLAHSHGADEGVAICRNADGNFDITFRLLIYEPVRRNRFSGPLGLLMQAGYHAPLDLPDNVESCICYLRDSPGFPIHSPLAKTDSLHRNIVVLGTDHNTVCLKQQTIEVAAAMAYGGNYIAAAMDAHGGLA